MPYAGLPLNWIIIGLICYSRRKEEIGGWLLFFYIQLYVGLAFSLLLLPLYIGGFAPSHWASVGRYLLFLFVNLSGWAIYLAQFVIAHRLRRSRDAIYLGPLKRVLGLNLVTSLLVLLLDIKYESLSIILDALMVLWAAVWLPYFHRSLRVGHVFVTKDWARVAELVVD